MSDISTIYDGLHTLVSGELTGYFRLPNPYAIEENPEFFLKKGYGIGIGGAEAGNATHTCKFQIIRGFSIVLISLASATESDAEQRGSLEKNLMEDGFKVIKALEIDETITTGDNNAIWLTDTGIEFLLGERQKFYRLQIDINVRYFEQLT